LRRHLPGLLSHKKSCDIACGIGKHGQLRASWYFGWRLGVGSLNHITLVETISWKWNQFWKRTIPGSILGLIVRLSVGLIGGLIAGLNRGGSAVIKHYALRLTLCLNGDTPFKFVKFLDQCARLILLKKVGGGYIFIHRTLLEYFAEMTPQSNKRLEAISRSGLIRPLNETASALSLDTE
jgi:hypothetical protein